LHTLSPPIPHTSRSDADCSPNRATHGADQYAEQQPTDQSVEMFGDDERFGDGLFHASSFILEILNDALSVRINGQDFETLMKATLLAAKAA